MRRAKGSVRDAAWILGVTEKSLHLWFHRFPQLAKAMVLRQGTNRNRDFQIQSMSEANGDYPNGHRNALGLFVPRHQKATSEKCPTCDGYLGFGRVCPDCGSGTTSEREGA